MNITGIIFTEQEKNSLSSLSSCPATLPFAGSFKIMDFALSDMVNAGIEKIGIITKNNYKSISSHILNGKDWDIPKNGIKIVLSYDPRYYANRYDSFSEKHGELITFMEYLVTVECDHVLLCDCRHIYNVDTDNFIASHRENNNDITVGTDKNGERIFTLIRFDVLKEIVETAVKQYTALQLDELLEKDKHKYKTYEYRLKGYITKVSSLRDYYKNSMELLGSAEKRDKLFNTDKSPVYTRASITYPSVYGEESTVSSSLVCEGCSINGTVENSILYENVYIGKGAVIKNSILLPGTTINEKAFLDCVVSGTDSEISKNSKLDGNEKNPIVFIK